MKKIMAYACAAVLVAVLTGCGASAKMIADKSASERSDIFMEVAGDEAVPSGYADVVITANIKTHLEGFYPVESKASAHGKEAYLFLVNIDGQAIRWKADGKKHELPAYVDGKASLDPEAGEGIKYVLVKKVRLRAGQHTLFFGLPEDDYYREVVIDVKEGEVLALEFKPEYKYKMTPTRIPTYMKGISSFAVLVNGTLLAK